MKRKKYFQQISVHAALPHYDSLQSRAVPAAQMGVEGLEQSKRNLRDDEKKALLVKQCCFRFELYLARKEMFYKETQKMLSRRQASM